MSYMYESNPLYGSSRRLRLGSFQLRGYYLRGLLEEIDRFSRDIDHRPEQFNKR